MYEYKFVEISSVGLSSVPEHKETINVQAFEGWKLVQVLPTKYTAYGRPLSYEAIFEREIRD